MSASPLEQSVAATVSDIEDARKSGASVEDLVNRLNSVVVTLDSCGWESCEIEIQRFVETELVGLSSDAKQRTRNQEPDSSLLLITIVILIVAIIIFERKFSLIHRIRWSLLKNRRIQYPKKSE
ncbi:MAG: hypothetical protein ACXAB7_09205 [Candidatus Kariarchaeaceae archaeon]|jgi:hypothetical protein